MGNKEDAFYFFERSRAVLLYDQLNEQRWLKEEDIVKQTQLRKIITHSERELASLDKESSRSLELQKQIMSDRQELDQLNNKIKTKNPLYYQNFLETGNISIRDVQLRLLKGNDKLIEFFDGDSAVYSLIITPSDIYLDKIDKETFDRLVTEFISFISDHEKLNKNFDRFVNASYSLYQLIFQKHSMLPGRIIISPDSRYFPIEALVTNKVAPLAYLIQTHPVSYTHSARFLMIDFNTGTYRGTRNLMGIAPVNFRTGLNQASLTGSDISLQKIKADFPDADIRIFNDASKNNFLQQFGQYRIIQLYTHASDKMNSGEPEIYFSDSVLYLSDLINEMKPVTKLIVLSACETGTGQWFRGEGVFSFNRGFAALGIPSSVTNLWSVDNQSTYKLTELFYKYLSKGMEIDIALQKAKMEFMEKGSKEDQMPWYWAATILAGKTDAIEMDKSYNWKNWIPGVGLAILLLTGLIIRANYKKKRQTGKHVIT
jgi:CHAT domain-containing protein